MELAPKVVNPARATRVSAYNRVNEINGLLRDHSEEYYRCSVGAFDRDSTGMLLNTARHFRDNKLAMENNFRALLNERDALLHRHFRWTGFRIFQDSSDGSRREI